MNTIFPPHTLGFACLPTLPAAGCGPAAPAAGNQGAATQQLSLPGCVPTHTIAPVCTQIGCQPYLSLPGCVPHTMWFICPPVTQAGGAQNTAATVCTQIGCQPHISLPGCVHTGVCPPPANGGQAQAQFQPTQTAATTCTQIGCPPANGGGQPQALHISFSPYCLAPANAVAPSTSFCTGPMCHAPAQPNAAGPQFNSTQFHSCPPCNAAPATEQAQTLISAYTYCPTVAPLCPPPANGGQAQAQFQPTQTAATTCTQIGCPQPEPHLLSAPPHCPVSPPANGGGQAQAQTFPLTLPPFCPIYTIPPFCPQPTNAGGQAHTLPHTHLIGCPNTSTCSPAGQAGGGEQAQTLPHTQLGCPNTATCSPVTHAFGCPNTSTCSPDTAAGGGQVQAQAFTFFGFCPPVNTLNCIPSIPGCFVPTLNCQQAPGRAQAQGFPFSLPPLCPQPTNAGGQAQAQTLPHTHLIGCPNTATCSPTTQAGGGQAQAQTMFPTLVLPCTFIICNQAQGGAQGGAQAQTIWHTQPGYCSLSTPPLCPTVAACPPANAGQGSQASTLLSAYTQCPTVAPMCPPANGGQGPQTNTLVSAYTHCPTVPPMCQHTAPPTCPQPLLSAPPHCPTVAPMCAPANGGGQAQAQGFTILGICPHTISPVMCVLTQIAGCGA